MCAAQSRPRFLNPVNSGGLANVNPSPLHSYQQTQFSLITTPGSCQLQT
jgi:hypothetical protein